MSTGASSSRFSEWSVFSPDASRAILIKKEGEIWIERERDNKGFVKVNGEQLLEGKFRKITAGENIIEFSYEIDGDYLLVKKFKMP